MIQKIFCKKINIVEYQPCYGYNLKETFSVTKDNLLLYVGSVFSFGLIVTGYLKSPITASNKLAEEIIME